MDLDKLVGDRLNASYLLVSLLWSTVGGGYCIYARKQREVPPLVGGVGLIAISWVIDSAFWMSLAGIGIIVGVWYWIRNSD